MASKKRQSIDDFLKSFESPEELEESMANLSAIISRDRSGNWGDNDDQLVRYGELKEAAEPYRGVKKGIKSDDPEERKFAIRKIGDARPSGGDKILVYVADGGVRSTKTSGGVWGFFASVKPIAWYELDDQLESIRVLGKTGLNDEYVKSLVKLTGVSDTYLKDVTPRSCYDGGPGMVEEWAHNEFVYFPNPLRGQLNVGGAPPEVMRAPGRVLKNGSRYLPDNEAGRVVREAYDRALGRKGIDLVA